MLSSGYLLSVSKDTSLQFWNLTSFTSASNGVGYGQAIACVKEVQPNVIAVGDLLLTGVHYIYLIDVSDVTDPMFYDQISYTAGPAQACFDMKLYGSNNLVVASNQQFVDVWTLDSLTHSTLTIGSPGPTPPVGNIMCIEPLSKFYILFRLNQLGYINEMTRKNYFISFH